MLSKLYRALLILFALVVALAFYTPEVVQGSGTDTWIAQYYNNSNLEGGPVLIRAEAFPQHDWGFGSPGGQVQVDNFSALWVTTQELRTGNYEIAVRADDGVRVYVDGQLLLDEWHGATAETYRTTFFATGQPQTFAVEYYENTGAAFIELTIDRVANTTTPDNQTNWLAQYYNNPNLEGGPVHVRNEASPNHNWGNDAPISSMPSDNFSVRWTEFRNMEGGRYRITVGADDGVRVFVDDRIIIDEWHTASGVTYEETFTLESGWHSFMVEYYDARFNAQISYNIERVPEPTNPVPLAQEWVAQYYNNRDLAGGPVVVRREQEIRYDWGEASPSASINRDNFSARWTTSQFFEAGRYEMSVVADDGVRVYVDGQTIIDEWRIVDSGNYTETISLTSGQHTITVEYFEAEGRARVSFNLRRVETITAPQPPSGTADGVWFAEYYNNPNLEGEPLVTAQEQNVNYYWGTGSPIPPIGNDNFSVRWTQRQRLSPGLYTINVRSDDGVRVYANGELVINAWDEATSDTYTATINLPGGSIPFVIEYYEERFNAFIDYDLVPYSTVDYPVINPDFSSFGEWTVEYYNNQNLFGSPVAILSDQGPNHNWGNGSPLASIQRDGFGARWTISEPFEAGTYQITVNSDDGVRVWVDNEQVIDEWHVSFGQTYTARVDLTSGTHTIRVDYYEGQGDARISFSMETVEEIQAPPESNVQAPQVTGATGTVDIYRLNVRDLPSTTDGDVLEKIDPGSTFPIVGRNSNDTWWQIRLSSGQDGWVFGRFMQAENTRSVPVTFDVNRSSSDVTISAQAIVNIRRNPSTDARILGNLRPRDTAQLLARTPNNSWWKIDYDGVVGWIVSGAASISSGESLANVPVEN